MRFSRVAPIWIGVGALVAAGVGVMLAVSSGKPAAAWPVAKAQHLQYDLKEGMTMTLMSTVTFAATLTALSAAAVGAQTAARTTSDTPLTLTGCVVQGDRPDSFLLTDMTVGGAGASSAPANAYFRFDTTKGLAPHVNHKVEISGMADLTDIDKGSVTKSTNSAGQTTTTAINSERRTITAKEPAAGTVPSTKTKVDTYKFKVGTIRMISATCP